MSELPDDLYDAIPPSLCRVAECLDVGHERDTYLTGVLPVASGAMPMVRFRYGSQWLSPNLYTAVIAPAGSGKGKFRIAKRCGLPLDERLYQQSRHEIEEWERRADTGDEDLGPRPHERTLFLPGDTSAAAMKRHLKANPASVMFETEFKTVGTVLGQEWGQFRDVMLKAAHNESVTVSRSGEDLLRIGHPALSAAISGTPSTFTEIIDDVEDGLFSRFLMYRFETESEWVPQFQDESDEELDHAVEVVSSKLDGLHEALSRREDPLYCTFPRERQKQHTKTCRSVLGALKSQGIPKTLHANVKRGGLAALRIASLFSIFRRYSEGGRVENAKSIAISERDLYAGLQLAFCYTAHALHIADRLTAADDEEGLHAGHREYLNALPDGAFDTAEADDIAEELGIHERKARRWRKKFASRGLLVDEGYGSWRRPQKLNDGNAIQLHSIVRMGFPKVGDMDDRPRLDGENVQPVTTQASL
jgi:hypothetical protein